MFTDLYTVWGTFYLKVSCVEAGTNALIQQYVRAPEMFRLENDTCRMLHDLLNDLSEKAET